MAVRRICVLPDPVLRQKAKKVTVIDSSVQRLIDDMTETMKAASGVGLAAPQVGVSLRVAVIGIPGEEIITLVNPEIVYEEFNSAVIIENGGSKVGEYTLEGFNTKLTEI